MGCAASRIDREERVRICKERKRLMKQLLVYRREFVDALLAYLRALKNTGATLRQFTESDSLEVEESTSEFVFPSFLPPPPPLPPSPPPRLTFSPDSRTEDIQLQTQRGTGEEIEETDEDSSHTPPPPLTSSSWYWDPFNAPITHFDLQTEIVETDEENWADANSQFSGEDGEEAAPSTDEANLRQAKHQKVEWADDNQSTVNWHAKDSSGMGMLACRSNKTLSTVIDELDEYFLKASAVVKNIAVVIDVNMGDTFLFPCIKENKSRRSNSAKVFRALTWSWSLKLLQSSRETKTFSEVGEPCKPGAHCISLKKLYSEEQKLYKDVKEEVIAKVDYGRKSLLLQRQEEEHDWVKAEKTRLAVENLESYIFSLQESIRTSYSTILKLINEELHPQIFALASGLIQMWRIMYKCHKAQNQISQQLMHTTDEKHTEPTSEYHRQAAAQLLTEVTCWYDSFCRLVKFQREYICTLCEWTELTSSLGNANDCPEVDDSQTAQILLKEWLQTLDKLPDKRVSEAIKNLLFAVEAIVLQQQEECNIHKRSDRIGRKFERELHSLSEVEMKFEGSSLEDANCTTTLKHPLLIRRAKVAALQAVADDEKAKYKHSVKRTRAMILNNLQTSLPSLFEALTAYTKAYIHSFDSILDCGTAGEHENSVDCPDM